MKRRATLWLVIFIVLAVGSGILLTTNNRDRHPFVYMEGKALGVVYSIVYQGDEAEEKKIDSIIHAFDLALNTDRPDSEISAFNKNGYLEFRSPILPLALQASLPYTESSRGAVSHMVFPLIQAWGREFANKREMTPERIEQLKQLIHPDNLEIAPRYIRARQAGVMINFSYLDKGLLIDQLTQFLLEKGRKNFQLEFGTDAISYGNAPKSNSNRHIVLHPQTSGPSTNIIKETPLKNKAYSSSGSLEKFYVDGNGFKHSHLIDPRTGKPIENKVLSTHIKASTCLKADAMATLCMILTVEEASQLVLNDPDLEGLIVYNEKGDLQIWKSPGFELFDRK